MRTTQTQTRTRHPLDQCPTRNMNPSWKPRQIRSPAFARARLRRNAGIGGKRSRGPTTPLLKWKLGDADIVSGSCSSAPESDKGCGKERKSAVGERDEVTSARKLAAGIWHVNGGLGFEDERVLKRQRRKQSNRESARRSRLRKQAECEELAQRVEVLKEENASLREELNQIKNEYDQLFLRTPLIRRVLETRLGEQKIQALTEMASTLLMTIIKGHSIPRCKQ